MSEALKNLINIHQEEAKKCGLLDVLKLEHEVYKKIDLKKENTNGAYK